MRIGPGGAFDMAGGFSRFRVKEHGKQSDCAFIVFALPAHVTYPGWEVRNRDEFITQPGEIGDVAVMHDTRRAFVTRYGSEREG